MSGADLCGVSFGLAAMASRFLPRWLAEIRSVIDEEAKNIEKIIELNERDQSDRDRALAQLGTSMTTLARHRQALQQVLITARQTV